MLFSSRQNTSFGEKSVVLENVIINILIEVPIGLSIHWSQSHIAEEIYLLYYEFFAQIYEIASIK